MGAVTCALSLCAAPGECFDEPRKGLRVRKATGLMAAVAAGVTLMTGATPAQASETDVRFRNQASQRCLGLGSIDGTFIPRQSACDAPGVEWTFAKIREEADGRFKVGRLKNELLGKCLDGNEQGVLYFSNCNSSDAGQTIIITNERASLVHRHSYSTVTGWADGSVSAYPRPRYYGELSLKQKWYSSKMIN